MRKGKIIRLSFILASFTILIGAWFKILHYPYANVLLVMGLVAIILSTVLSLHEIHTSQKVNTTEKIVWTLGFLFMNWVTGLIYIIAGRKSVLS
jgi:hypothetical protein